MSPKLQRKQALRSFTIQGRTDGCGVIYTTVTVQDDKPFEMFTGFGKAGGCACATAQAISELVSRAWRSGMDTRDAVLALSGHQCHMGPNSCMARMALAIKAVDIHLSKGGEVEDILDQLEAEKEVHHA